MWRCKSEVKLKPMHHSLCLHIWYLVSEKIHIFCNLCWNLTFLLPLDLTIITLQSSNYLFFTIFFISVLFIFTNNCPYFNIITSDTSLASSQWSMSFPFFCLLLSTTLGQVLCLSLPVLNIFHACLHFILDICPGYNYQVSLYKARLVALVFFLWQ